MAPQTKRMVTVYDADNKPHKVDNLNAIDMVTSLGYTYKPGRDYVPVDHAPHALRDAVDHRGARKAQSILDAVGSNGGSPVIDEPPPIKEVVIEVDDEPEAPVPEADTSDEPTVDSAADDEDLIEEDEAPAPTDTGFATVQPSRGRPKKA